RLASAAPSGGEMDTISDVLAAADAMLNTRALAPLQEVIAGGIVITLEDARSGRIWQATNGSVVLRKTADALTLSVTSEIFNGTDDLAGLQVSLSRARATGQVSAGFSASNMPARDIAAQSPILAWLGVLDAPISGNVRTEIDANGTLLSFAGTLEFDEGALQPTPEASPVSFSKAQAYFTFDPARQRLDFSDITLGAEDGRLVANGHTYLAEFDGLWPQAYLGQFQIQNVDYTGPGFDGPVSLSNINTDLRLRLDPFTVEFGQITVDNQGIAVNGSGRILADEAGWHAAIDASTAEIKTDRVMQLWPVAVSPISRGWIARNLQYGTLLNPSLGFRYDSGEKPDVSMSFEFEDGVARFLPEMPLLTSAAGRASMSDFNFSLTLTQGNILSETGDTIDATGTRFTVEDTRPKPATAQIDVVAEGALQGALSILNNRPLRIMERAKQPIDIASATAKTWSRITLPLKDNLENDDVTYEVVADLTDVSSDTLVEGRVFAADALRLTADNDTIGLDGAATLDDVPLTASWRQPLGPEAANGGEITGSVTLSPETVAAFDLPLPEELIRGAAQAEYTLSLPADGAPSELVLQSDLRGLSMGLGAVGWQKGRNQTGTLTVEATLGEVPDVTRLALDAPGLSLEGAMGLRADGSMDAARFDTVRIGNWLDADVTLTPTPGGGAPTVNVTGGSLDIRQLDLGAGRSGSGGGGGPIRLQLDRLTVSDGIALAPLTGQFENGPRGLSGRFEARMNGRTPVRGSLGPSNAGTAFRLQADDAGGVLRDAGLTPGARNGSLDIILAPAGDDAPGTLRGDFVIEDLRLSDAPTMASLLDAISVVGLIDQLSGPGIMFDTIDGQFRLNRRQIRLDRAAAVGPSIGISADGIYDLQADRLDLQGVISPVYFLNGIGSLFTRRGEGLFGFNYRVAGSADAPSVGVNPLSILTPGAFRQIFRSAPPEG
ncbi:MAG: AsmA-like C-terminal region-containing protein, partial [Pseudomonadota bacterium]